jgi:hypothetical protein
MQAKSGLSFFNMVLSKASSVLEQFTRLSTSVYLHEPTSKHDPNSPDLILISGWMDARPRHLAKYTHGYEKLYPSARIILISTTGRDCALSTHTWNLKRISPVLEIISHLPSDAKILLHTASMGGGWTSALIARAYFEQTGRLLPVTAMVLDGSPGRTTFKDTVAAFAAILPRNVFVRLLGIFAIRVIYGLYMFAYMVLRKKNLIDALREDLNDPKIFRRKVTRLYIFSDGDEVVRKRDVVEHAVEAEGVGYRVLREEFEKGAHCALLLEDEERYWGSVRRLWGSV